MSIKDKKNKWMKCVPIFLLTVLLLLSGCGGGTTYPISLPQIDSEEITEYLSYQHCTDGGFADNIHPSVIDFTDLYDTYCALHILDMLDAPIPMYDRCIGFVQKISCQDLIQRDTFDDIFYYLMIAHYLDYQVPEEQMNILLDYITSLQTEEGAIKPNQDFSKIGGNVDYSNIYDPLYLMAATHFVELSQFYQIEINFTLFINYLQSFPLMEMETSSSIDAISVLLQAKNLYPVDSDSVDHTVLQTLYSSGLELLSQNEYNSITLLRNLSIIGNALGQTEELASFLPSYFCKDGFSIFPEDSTSHIMATRVGLQACQQMSVSLELQHRKQILAFLASNQFYDGRFVFNRKDINNDFRIYDTYYAAVLLDELGQLEPYQSDLQSFYHTQIESLSLREHSIEDSFYLISIAFYSGLQLEDSDILWFQESYCAYVNDEDITPNYIFYSEVMESPFLWKTPVSDTIKSQLIDSYERDSVLKTQATLFMQLYYQYTVLSVIQDPTPFYQTVIDYYNQNFDSLIIPYFAATYIAKIIDQEDLSYKVIDHYEDIIQNLNRSTDGCLFLFPEENLPASFLSTRAIIQTIKVFSEQPK